MEQFVGLLPLVFLMVFFYVIIILPQQRQQKRRRELLAALKNGDQVLTAGGVLGTITGINDNVVNLRVNDKTEIRVVKSAVERILNEQ
ncbi:MAG: preprotein translocase subunit YajC [Firmicutes bacterium]|nr:preprotein translocase subunit YajC [Bacillota bacterium]